MASTVLVIGLDPELLDQIQVRHGTHIVTAPDFKSALSVLQTTDISAVLIDSRSSSQLRDDINMLLADTPVTTSINLIIHPSDIVSPEMYSALGVKTLHSPVSVDTLNKVLA